MLWRATTTGDKFGYSSACLVDGRLYIGCLGDIGEARCVSATDGKEIWCGKVGSVIYDSSPAFDDGHVVVGSVDGVLHRIRASDGLVASRYRLPTGHLLASPAAARAASFGDVVRASTLREGAHWAASSLAALSPASNAYSTRAPNTPSLATTTLAWG